MNVKTYNGTEWKDDVIIIIITVENTK